MLPPTQDGHPPLVGRDRERDVIASLLDDVRSRGSALVLRGGPGLGKSRLLQEARALAERREVAVLATRGVPAESDMPFSALHQLLRPIRARSDQLPLALRAPLDAALGVGDGVAPEPFRIAMAVLELLSTAAIDTPLLLIMDDAHWLDRASADALAFVARRLSADPVVMLAATREGYAGGLGDAGLPELSLTALAPAAAAELLDRSGAALSLAARQRLLREAEGNPLALIELPLAVSRSERSMVLSGEIALTDRLEHAFAARVSELAPDTRLLLVVAAVSGSEQVDEVLRVAGAVADRAVDFEALEPAATAALIDLELTTLRFRHPLMRSAVQQRASIAERRAVHQATAETLDDDPDRRAWHRAALISGPHPEVAAELEQASMRARGRGATAEALTALQRAAELSTPDQRGARLLAAAQLARDLGDVETATELLAEVRRLGPNDVDRARAAWIEELVDPRPLASAARILALVAAAERAGDAGDRELHIDMLWMVAFRTVWADVDPSARQALIAASARLGGAHGDDARTLSIHAHVAPLAHGPAVVARLQATAQAGDYDPADARHFGTAAVITGAFDLAAGFLDVAVEGLRADGQLGYLGRMLILYGLVAAQTGDWAAATAAAEEARRLAREFREPLTEARANAVLAMVDGMRGNAKAALQAARSAEHAGASVGAHDTVALAQFGHVAAALAAGRYADAYASAQRLFVPADPAYHPPIGCWLIGDLAEAGFHAGLAGQARTRVAEIEALVGDAPASFIAQGLRHARAVLAQDSEAAAVRFADALDADLSGWPWQRARLLLSYGQWLRRERRIAESREPLRAARDAFDALRSTAWSDRAREELRASGEASPRRDAAASDQLTAQELQIAQLAGEGLSNREIGERLYLSPRTISTYLYRLFPKLGITSRAELPAALKSSTAPS